MIRETYLSNLKNLPEGAIRVRVCRPARLSPSKELLRQYKSRQITWETYVEQYRLELVADRKAYPYLEELARRSQRQDIYLYCLEKDPTHCHRSILMDILRGMGAMTPEGEDGHVVR